MTSPLLVAYDGSEDAANAIACAGRVLAPRRALVVHSFVGLSRMLLRSNVEVVSTPLAEMAKELDAADAEEAERIAAEGAQLAIAAGFEAQPICAEQLGKPWQTLVAVAKQHDAAAIVAGARGRSGVASAVLGSVSSGLVHHSHVPTLVVPAKSDKIGGGPALLCYDGSETSNRAIVQAGGLVARKEAVVLDVWRSWSAHTPASALSSSVAGMARELDEIAEDESSERAADGVALAARAGFNARPLSARGQHAVWQTVVEVAAREEASLVAVGSRGMTGPAAALGSVSHGVLHHSGRPVVIVPPPPDE